jgi:hypothetical protein
LENAKKNLVFHFGVGRRAMPLSLKNLLLISSKYFYFIPSVLLKKDFNFQKVLMNIFEYQFPQMRERYREIVIRAKIEASPITKYIKGKERKVGIWYTLNEDGSIG